MAVIYPGAFLPEPSALRALVLGQILPRADKNLALTYTW